MDNDTKVVLVDDHKLLREGLAKLITSLDYQVIFEADNGKDFIAKLEKAEQHPDIVLMDINMPLMDGFETTLWLKKNHSSIKVLALSMYDDENAIIRMLKNGAKGYVVKDVEPQELRTAIDAIVRKGFYYSDMVTGRLVHSIQDEEDQEGNNESKMVLSLNEREIQFLKLASTEMTYKQIADQMFLSARTIDGYRDVLFEKLNVKSRVGLVLFAIKNGIVRIN